MGSKLSVLNCTASTSRDLKPNKKKPKKKKKLGEKLTEEQKVIDDLRTTASKLTPSLSRLEQDLVQNQVRDVEKHLSDIQIAAGKKSRGYQVLGTSLGDVQTEIEQYLQWLQERDAELSKQDQLSHTVSYVENRLLENKRLIEDLQGRHVVLDNISSKLDNLTHDLSKPERARIDDMVRTVQDGHKHIFKKAEDKKAWLEECLEAREKFTINFDKTIHWLIGKEKIAAKLKVARLHSSDIEKQMEKSKALLKEVVQYEATLIVLEDMCDKVQETTDSEGNESIQQTRRDFNIRYNALRTLLESFISELKDSLIGRKQLEADMTKVELWCREVEVKTSGELKLDCSLEVLDEQRRKYLILKSEADSHDSLIKSITQRAETFADNLETVDNNSLQQQLRSLRERHFLILTLVEERCQALEASFKMRSEVNQRITESETWLTSAQEDIRRLNRPIGDSVEDANLALQEYQTLKQKLMDYRSNVAGLNQSVESLRSSGHVTDAEDILRITTQHEWLMDQAEQYASKCQQAITLRQQFVEQSNQVNTLSNECEQQILEVKQSNDTVTVKLSKLKAILTKLQSAEPMVGVLQDKHQQISMEGQKGNTQALNSQIITLQTRIVELRSLVHEETLACERTQHEHEDFESEIEQTIHWMEEKYQLLLTKSPLELDAEKVDLALKRHKTVSEDILNTLEDVKAKVHKERARFEDSGEPLPDNLQHKLKQLNQVEEKILAAIESKEQYLVDAKSDRWQFETSLRQVTDWLHGAEDLLSTNQDGLDYDTIYHQLEEHKEYFMEGSLCQDEMEQILELSDRLLPTLDKTDQLTLQQSLSNINQKVNSVIVAAQKRQDLLEKKVTEWREYDLASQQVTHVLDQLEEQWSSLNVSVVRGPDDTNQQLKHSQEFLQMLEKHRPAIEELNAKSHDLDEFATTGSRGNLSQTLSRVNERWNTLVAQVENKQGSLQDLDKDFESYKDLVASLQKHLSEVNLKMPESEVKAMSGQQLTSALQEAKSQDTKLMLIQPQLTSLKKQAEILQQKLPGAEARVHVQERMMELIEHYGRVSENVHDCEQSVQDEMSDRDVVSAQLQQTTTWLRETQQQLSNLRPGKDSSQMQERIEKQKLMEQEVAIRMEQMKRLMAAEESKYSSIHKELPSELKKNFKLLESQRAELDVAMKEKEEELLHLREDRQEFKDLFKLVHTWLDEAAIQVKQPIKNLEDSNRKHQELLSEFDSFKDKLSALKEVGREISLHTSDPTEKDSTQKSFSKVSKKWSSLQKLVSERTEDLQRATQIRQLIDDKVEEVQTWTEKAEKLLATKLAVKSFEDAKLKLQDHKTLVKDGERFQSRLTELRGSVNDLSKLCDTSSLSKTMADLKKRIQFIQTQLGDRLHLLEQANIEVLQYERDTAELYHWIDQTRAHLMVKDNGVPLKTQHDRLEQLLDEIESQKARAKTILDNPPKTLGLRKVNPVDAARLLRQIDHLSQHATDQLEQLRDAVQTEEHYEREIQDLTMAIEDAQRQLQDTPVSVATVEGLRLQMAEHTALTEKIRIYQAKLYELNQKYKELSRRTFPLLYGSRRNSTSSLDGGIYLPVSQGSSVHSLVQSGLDSGFPLSLNSSFTMTPQFTLSTSDSFGSTGKRDTSGFSTSGLGMTLSTGNLSLNSDTSQLDSSGGLLDKSKTFPDKKDPKILSSMDILQKYGRDNDSKTSQRLVSESSSKKDKFEKLSPRSVSLDQEEISVAVDKLKSVPPQANLLTPSQENVHVYSRLGSRIHTSAKGNNSLTLDTSSSSLMHDISPETALALLSSSLPDLASVTGLKKSRSASVGGKHYPLRSGQLSQEGKLNELNLSWNTLQQQLGVKEKELQAALQKQEKYQESVKTVTDRLENIQSKLSSSLPVSQEELKQELEEYKVMLLELQTVKEDISRVREKGRQIMEVSDPEGYRTMQATMSMLGDRVKGLESATEDRGKQLHRAVKDQEKHHIALEAYKKRVKDLNTWLTQSRMEHGGVAIPGEAADKLKYQLEENKNLQNELNTRFQQLSDLAVQCDDLCEMEPAVSADRLRRQLADIQASLGEFKLETLENHGRLKSGIKDSEKREREMGEYEGSVKKLQQWITDTRRLTTAPVSAEVKARISNDQIHLQELETNLVEHRKLLKSLSSSGLKVTDRRSTEAGVEGVAIPATSAELQFRWQTLSRDLEQKRLDSQDTLQQDKPWSSRPVAMETRSLLLSGTADPTVSQLADIHRVLFDLNECWRHMQTEVKDKQLQLDEALDFQQHFQDALLSASTWLDSAEMKLSTPDYGKTSQDKMKETENILEEIRSLQQEILTISKVSQQLLSEGSGNKVLITQSLTDLNERVRLLEARAYKREAEISRTETRWGELRAEVQGFRKNINDAQVEFDGMVREPSIEDRFNKNKRLEDQITRYEAQLEVLEDKGRRLAESNPRMSVNTELTILRHSIAELRRQIHENREELRQFVAVQEHYGNILADYEGFLETAQDKLRPETISAKNLEHLNQQVTAHKEFFGDFEEHRAMVDRLALLCGQDTKEKHLVQQQRLNNLTKIVEDKASLHSQRLGRLSRLWTDLDGKIIKHKQFMADVQHELPAPVSEEDSLKTIQSKYEVFHRLQNSLNDEKSLVHEIVEKGKQILHIVNCPHLETGVTELADRFVELHSKVSAELHRAETLAEQWQTFEADSAVLQSWFVTANSQLSSLKQVTEKDLENIGAIRSKVDKLLEFRKEVDAQSPLKNKVITVGQQLLRSRTVNTGSLEERLTQFEEQWGQLSHDIDMADESLHQTQMELMPSRQALNELLVWLESVERSIREDKDRGVRSLADIEAMLKKYTGFKIDLGSKQLTVDFVNETVLHLSQETLGQPSEKTEFAEKLGQLNKRWQLLDSDVMVKLKNLETLREKWADYEKGVKQLQDWLVSQEDRVKKFQLIGNEMHVRQTLRECKTLQESLRGKEDEIESRRRLGLTLMDQSSAKGAKDVVDNIHTQWSALVQQVEQLETVLNDVLAQWSEYHTELSSLTHTMNETDYSLTRLDSISPDVYKMKVQVEKLKMLQAELDNKVNEVERFSTLSNQLMQVCDPPIRQDLQKTLGDLKLRWNKTASELRNRYERFNKCLSQWENYEMEHTQITEWLSERERQFNQLNAMRDDPSLRQKCLQQSKTLQAELEGFPSQLTSLVRLGEEFTENLDTPVSGPITSQQAKLTQRVSKLQQSINKHTKGIQEDLGDQTRFQEYLTVVTEFLRSAEHILEGQDPDKSDDSALIQRRLEELKNLFGQFSNNESKIDTLNDLGYRMALSEAYSEKLLHLNHQWQNLQTDAADRYRRMQALLLLQQDFTEKVGNWVNFLDQAQSDLTKDIAGNYDDLLEQQRKSELFQAEIFSRQQILQAIIGDGQRKLRQGEVTNPDDFQNKLAVLSSQWQNVVKQSNHRKTVIDKAILQWQTYRALRDRLNSWLRNREHDLKAYDFDNISLQKVKYLLEKARSNLKEYKTQEENFRKLHEVSQELLQRADSTTEQEIQKCLSDLQQRWYQTFGQFDGQRERLEEVLRKWQLCEQELEDILSWLRDLRFKLGSELPNSYDELQKDLLLCKEIETSFERAEPRRQELLAQERQLNSVVEAVDLSVLRERIRLLNKQWDELRNQGTLRSHRINDKLHEWSGFNEKYRELSDWMDQMETKISSRTEYHVEDLLLKLQKDYRFEMDMKERVKVELVDQGRQLMKASSEIRATDINNKVAKLEDKWRHLKAVIAYRQHKLQETLLAVQQLEMSMVNLRKWLGEMEHELTSPVIYHDSDIKEIQRKLYHQQELQKDIEKHSAGVASVLNLCEVLLRDSDACPTEVEYAALQQASRTLDKRWRNICQLAADRKYKVDETWRMWQQFETETNKFSTWVKDVELQLREPRSSQADVALLKEDVRHFEAVQKKVHENLSQLETINKQYRKMAREGRTDNGGKMKIKMQDANDQWDSLSQRVTETMRRLKQPSGMKTDFITTRTTILRWLKEIETKLTEIEQSTDMDISTRIIEMKEIETELETNRRRIEYINDTALYLIEKGDPVGSTEIQDLLDEFHRYQRTVLQKIHTYQVTLKKISDTQTETVSKRSPSREDRSSIERETTTVISQREKHKASFRTTTRTDDTEIWEIEGTERYKLSPPDSPPEKRRATARVSPRPGSRGYSGEASDSGVYMTREERRRFLKDEFEQRGRMSHVDDIIERLIGSLEDAAEKLGITERELRCQTPTGPDTDYAPRNYAELVADCEDSITIVRRFERELKRVAGVTSMPSVDAQIKSVIHRWEILQTRAVEKDCRLHQHREDWAQFQIDLNNMLSWLDESEAFLENESVGEGEMTLLESVIHRHKDFLLQLESKKKVVMSLNLVGKNFVYNKSDECLYVRERLRVMNKRWESVCSKATVLHRELQLGLAHSQEFQQMIHDLLLWLEGVENKLQQIEPVSLAADQAILTSKYRRLLDLKDDMEERQPEVIALKETADQLLITTESPDMAMARDKTRIIANRLRALMKRCLTYIRQLEASLGLATSASTAKYEYLDSLDSGLESPGRSSPRSRSRGASPYPRRPRSALTYARQLLFGARAGESHLDDDTTTLTEEESSQRPAFLSRVIRTALPLQILMLLLLGLACLVPVCEEEYECLLMNNLERSWSPMLRYTDRGPPT